MREIKTLDEFNALKEKEKVVVVDFYADWCGPCKAIAPFLQKLSEEYTDVTFVKVNVDENDETAQDCEVSAMPTFHMYKDGKKVDELVGASQEKLRAMIVKNK